jgi:ribosome-binding factor A|tara:strand:+ start:2450 stop:2899 length:450 start_codon:yes stop_codon:yes gene_type:complete
MTKNKGKPASQRQLRVGEELRHTLAQLFAANQAHDPALLDANITVTEVRVSSDLKHATVFVMPFGQDDPAPVVAALKHAAPFFRRRLADVANMRFTPTLGFQLDKSFAEAAKIDKLLRSERVQQDLRAARDADDAPAGQGAESDDGAAS